VPMCPAKCLGPWVSIENCTHRPWRQPRPHTPMRVDLLCGKPGRPQTGQVPVPPSSPPSPVGVFFRLVRLFYVTPPLVIRCGATFVCSEILVSNDSSRRGSVRPFSDLKPASPWRFLDYLPPAAEFWSPPNLDGTMPAIPFFVVSFLLVFCFIFSLLNPLRPVPVFFVSEPSTYVGPQGPRLVAPVFSWVTFASREWDLNLPPFIFIFSCLSSFFA